MLAIEDSGFYEHGAINLSSLVRAVDREHPRRRGRAGRLDDHAAAREEHAAGLGSTSLARKFQELALAQRVEQKYSKDQILEMYLNNVFLGNNVYGIGTAAHFYFHKPASELTLARGRAARRTDPRRRATTTRSTTRTPRTCDATTCSTA